MKLEVGQTVWIDSTNNAAVIVSVGRKYVVLKKASGREEKFFIDNRSSTHRFGSVSRFYTDYEELRLREEQRRLSSEITQKVSSFNRVSSLPVGALRVINNLMTPRLLRHWKGKDYLYIGEGLDTEQNVVMVYYSELDGSRMYNRPKAMMYEDVEGLKGEQVPRFILESEE